MKSKKGQITSLVTGVGSLIITVIIILVITSTLLNANLLTGVEKGAAGNLSSNFSAGIDNVSAKVPTIFLVAAVVLLFGVLALLILQARRSGIIGGGSQI